MATTFTKYCLILIALTACCLAYFSFTLPMTMNENKRILSVNVNSCGQVKECPEGEEAYFRTYPDVKKKPISIGNYLEKKKEDITFVVVLNLKIKLLSSLK